MKSFKSSFIFINCLIIASISQPVWSQSQGPFNPATKSNDIFLGGSVAWSNPGNIGASDNTYALATNGTTNFLMASNFGFSIPATATITGIVAEVERNATPQNAVASTSWTTFTQANYTSGTATALYGNTSYTYNLPVSSATNNKRLLVVTVGIENVDNASPSDPSITFGTVTYNGVAMTLAISNSMASSTTSNNVAVYYLPESGLPSGTGNKTLVINKTFNGESSGGTITPDQFVEVVGVSTFTYVDQATPISAVTQTSASTSITSPAISNLRNGDYLVAATMNNTSSGGSITQASGYTENFEVPSNNTGGSTSGAILEVESKSLAGITGAPNATVSATAAGSSRLVMNAFSVNAARVYDDVIKLTNNLGIQVGSNLAVAPGNSLPNAWPDTDAYQTYGSSSNLWGTTWTPAQINSTNFGLSFQADASNSIASIDHIRMTVYYTVPLSVSVQSFTLTQTSDAVISSFAFSTNDNKKYQFVLEKAGSDLQFKPVDSMNTKGEYTLQKLSLADNHPSLGLNYYRMKIEEESHESLVRYSSVQPIIFGSSESKVLIYPNPAVDYMMIESDQKINALSLSDLTGNYFPVTITSLDNNAFKIENLPGKGSYILMINTDSGKISRQIMTN